MSQTPGPQHDDGPPGRGRARRRPSRGTVFRWAACVAAVALVAVSMTAYLGFRSISDSIKRVRLHGLGPQPPKLTSATNILLIGSDTRSAGNARFGHHVTGQRSDTIIVLHIRPGNGGVVALSLPRDSVVPVLSCPADGQSGGQTARPAQVEQINESFANGGPGCLWKTVEATTHLHLDHFIELNFTGFEKVIDDVGGVSICLPFAVNDPLSKLRLTAGRHHVMGPEALAFWRARYIGEGSDLQRIQRDQYLMASVLQGIEHADLMGDPARLLSVVTDAARSTTTDTGLSLFGLVGIIDSLRALPASSVRFIELPTVPYPANPDWVQWPSRDAALFAALARDKPLPARSATAAPGASPSAPAASPSPSASPSGRGFGGISGSANVCHDRSAFAGPLGSQ